MTPRYRKRPVEVEAFQMTQSRRWDNSEWPDWLHQAWNTEGEGSVSIDQDDPERERLYVWASQGIQWVTWDDYIVMGPEGDLHVCPPKLFDSLYELSEEIPFGPSIPGQLAIPYGEERYCDQED